MKRKKLLLTVTIAVFMLLLTIAGASAECTTGIKVFQKNATGVISIGFSSISGGEDISNGSLSNVGGQSWYINSSCGEFEIINITLGYSGASTSTGNQQLVVYNTTQGYHAPNPNEKIGYANQTNLTSAVGVYDNVSFYFNESFTVQDNQAIMFILWTDENPPEMLLQGGANYSEGTAGFNQEEGDWVDLGEDIPITIYYQTQAPTSPSIISFSTLNDTIQNGSSTVILWETANATNATLNQGVGLVNLTGSLEVSPVGNTTYTLTANNENGTVNENLTITVYDAPLVSVETSGYANKYSSGDLAEVALDGVAETILSTKNNSSSLIGLGIAFLIVTILTITAVAVVPKLLKFRKK